MKDRHRYIALENTFVDHPKTLAIGPLAAYLYISGLCYCDRHLTDGFIPYYSFQAIAGMLEYEADSTNDLLRLLEEEGLWERVEKDGKTVGWNVHDYLKHQLSKQALASLSEKRSDAGRKGGLASAKKRKQTQANPAKQTPSKRKQSNQEVDVEVQKDQNHSTQPLTSNGATHTQTTDRWNELIKDL